MYFKDIPELVEKIESKEFETNLLSLMEAYCQLKKINIS